MALTPSANRSMFTEVHRAGLKKLGLVDEQIDALSSRLHICKLSIGPLPPRNEVRDRLIVLRDSLEATHTQISTFLGGSDDAADEAIRRLNMADIEFHMALGVDADGETTERTLHSVGQAKLLLDQAIKGLPKEQRRNRSSSLYPIQEIENALLDGHVRHHDPNRTGKALPQFLLSATFAKKKPFERIARIFYEAMGYKKKNLDKPIRGYLAWRRKRNAKQRLDVEFKLAAGTRRIEEKKSGR